MMKMRRFVHEGSAGTEAGRFTASLRHCVTAPLRHCVIPFLVLICALFTSTPGSADAIVITKAMTASSIAEVFIEESVIRAEIEIGGPDLVGFRNLMPPGVYERLGNEPLSSRASGCRGTRSPASRYRRPRTKAKR
jgi:hypothetical protein